MNTITVTLGDELMADVIAEAKRRSISVEQAAADMIALRAYEAEHGPIEASDLAALDQGLAELARGERADPVKLAAFFKKHGT